MLRNLQKEAEKHGSNNYMGMNTAMWQQHRQIPLWFPVLTMHAKGADRKQHLLC